MPETDSDVTVSASRFAAFQQRSDELPPAWQMRAPGSRIGLLAGLVLVAALLAAAFGALLAG